MQGMMPMGMMQMPGQMTLPQMMPQLMPGHQMMPQMMPQQMPQQMLPYQPQRPQDILIYIITSLPKQPRNKTALASKAIGFHVAQLPSVFGPSLQP